MGSHSKLPTCFTYVCIWESGQRTGICLCPSIDASIADFVTLGTWNFSFRRALIRNNPVDILLDCGSEAIALNALEDMLEKRGEEVSRDGCDKSGDCGATTSTTTSSLSFADRLGYLLVTATARQFLSCMSLLLVNGANVNIRTSGSRRALLCIAVEKGNHAAVGLLLRYGAPLGRWSYPLELAASRGHIEIMASLLEAGAEVHDSRYNTETHPLVLASCSDNIDLVRLILDNGVGSYIVGVALKLCGNPDIKTLLRERFY